MLEAKNIRREFTAGDSTVVAVDDVSIALEDGVFAAIVGPSGSGKSTLLSVLGTLDMPTSGSILIDGRDITTLGQGDLTSFRRDTVGFVFQSYNLIPNLSAAENVMLPMEFSGMALPERRDRAGSLLSRVGLSQDKHRRRPGRLSGGEQQRVAIARALANRPSLVLADEPTGNLDSETGGMIVALLRELARSERTTIVAVTHDADVAAQADETFRLVDGRLVEPGSFESAASRANAAYDGWLQHRDSEHVVEFAEALAALMEAAPTDRRLSSSKIRCRYREIADEARVDALLRKLDETDLFEDAG